RPAHPLWGCQLRRAPTPSPRAPGGPGAPPPPPPRGGGGHGGHSYDYGDPFTGEYAGTEWDPCPCWDENRRWTLLPLPRLPRRRTSPDPWDPDGYNDEPPF
ncbi:hypothetical protein ACE14D_00745, partial [Streptomyces sp. Act-28]